VKESGVVLDFRPILKPHADSPYLKDSMFDDIKLEEESVPLEAD
jgi:hypothetical protein